MYRLYLLRHAEASRARPGGADFNRPLSERGRHEAAALGRRMRAEGYRPTFAFCSSATRARETWEIVAEHLEGPLAETAYMPQLYRGDAGDYRVLIATAPTEGSVLVVGHNPMIEELALTLVRGGLTGTSAALSGFPAGGFAVLDFAEPWWRIAPKTGSLVAFLPPQA